MGCSKFCARKASWLAFGLMALAVVSRATHDTVPEDKISLPTTVEVSGNSAAEMTRLTWVSALVSSNDTDTQHYSFRHPPPYSREPK
jgi:hypothetical protein